MYHANCEVGATDKEGIVRYFLWESGRFIAQKGNSIGIAYRRLYCEVPNMVEQERMHTFEVK